METHASPYSVESTVKSCLVLQPGPFQEGRLLGVMGCITDGKVKGRGEKVPCWGIGGYFQGPFFDSGNGCSGGHGGRGLGARGGGQDYFYSSMVALRTGGEGKRL